MTTPLQPPAGAGRVLSVSVGRPQLVNSGRRAASTVPTVSTAIWKQPVTGRVAVRGVNLDGDDQADRSVHGGPDKAVYAYAAEEVAQWQAELGRELGPAAFGQNLTTEGVEVSGAVIGERWRIGTTVLEVAQPRQPCFKLAIRMGDPRFVRRFVEASRPGAYLRIIEPGVLGAGDAVEVIHRPDHGITSRLVFEALLRDPALIPQALRAPELPEALRNWMLSG
jgi:MOSC domain-containing protein YiiM